MEKSYLDHWFGTIAGHEFIKDLLIKLIDSGRLSPALLFFGPALLGKKSLAIAVAKYLNCESQAVKLCRCHSCRRIAQDNHPDVRFIAPAGFTSVIRVESIRDMQDWAYITPIESTKKIVICDQAHRMNLSSANSMLKILEEPPRHLLIILITTNPYALLPTIRSRCTAINFNPLPETTIQQWLVEKQQVAENLAEVVALLSQGIPGKASEVMGEKARKPLKAGTQPGLAFTAWQEEMTKELKRLQQLGFASIFKVAQNLLQQSGSTEKLLDFLLAWYRDLLINKIIKGSEYLINKNLNGLIHQEAEHHQLTGIYKIIEELVHAQQLTQRTITPRLLLEVTLIKIGKIFRQFELKESQI